MGPQLVRKGVPKSAFGATMASFGRRDVYFGDPKCSEEWVRKKYEQMMRKMMDLGWIWGGEALDFRVPVYTGARFPLFRDFQKK